MVRFPLAFVRVLCMEQKGADHQQDSNLQTCTFKVQISCLPSQSNRFLVCYQTTQLWCLVQSREGTYDIHASTDFIIQSRRFRPNTNTQTLRSRFITSYYVASAAHP